MNRAVLGRIAVVLTVLAVVMMTTTTVMVAAHTGNGLIASLSGLWGLFNGPNRTTSNSRGGAGLHITVLPAPSESGDNKPQLVTIAFSGQPEGFEPQSEQIISNVLTVTGKVIKAPSSPSYDEPAPTPSKGTSPAPPVIAGLSLVVATPESGGTVKVDEVTLDVPAGAVKADTTFTILPAPPAERPTRGTVRIMGKEYVITATDADGKPVWEFDSPLSLSLPIPAGAKPEDLVISYWDEVLGEWVAVPTEIVGGQLIGSLTHLTVFAALAWPDLPRFVDLDGHWAQSEVVALSSLGIVNGYGDGTYRPEDGMTRAEAVKLIVTGLEVPSAPNVIAVLADEVPAWALPYVQAAMKVGIVLGYEDGTIRAEAYVTRAEWALMLMRAGQWAAKTHAEFTDELPTWAADAIETAAGLRLLRGYPDGTFQADSLLLRGEAAATVYRAIHLP